VKWVVTQTCKVRKLTFYNVNRNPRLGLSSRSPSAGVATDLHDPGKELNSEKCFNKSSPFNMVSLVVLRKYIFSLRKVEKDRSLVHVVTGRVNYVWSNVKMFGKASKRHDLMLLSTSVDLSLAFTRDSFLHHNLISLICL